MADAFLQAGIWIEIDPNRDNTINGQQIGPAWWASASPAERAALGIFPVIEVDQPDDVDVRVIDKTLEDHQGQPRRLWITQQLPLALARQRAIQRIRDKRAAVEAAGVTVGGVVFKTDERIQNRISGALWLFDEDPQTTSVAWEVSAGVIMEADRATIAAVGVAVGRHIQACFRRAATLTAAVLAAPDVPAIKAAIADLNDGWPS